MRQSATLAALAALLSLVCLVPVIVSAEDSTMSDVCNPLRPVTSDGFRIRRFAYVLRDVRSALECYKSISLPYDLASEHVKHLVEFFDEYYVFEDIARKPKKSPESNQFDFEIFGGRSDLVGGLRDLVNSWPPSKPVPLAKVLFPLNNLFGRLYDAHVSWGNGKVFGGLLDDDYSKGLHGPLPAQLSLLASYSIQPVRLFVKQNSQGDAIFRDERGREVSNIGGLQPMDWVRSLANSNVLAPGLPYKSEGVRVNVLLYQLAMGSMRYSLSSAVGNLNSLADVKYSVNYTDGTSSRFLWAVNMPVAWENVTLSRLSRFASTPGISYCALQKALGAFFQSDDYLVNCPSSKETDKIEPLSLTVSEFGEGRERRRRRLKQEEKGVEDKEEETDEKSTRVIECEDGSPCGEYGIRTSKNEQGKDIKYAVWKLNEFNLEVKDYSRHWLKFLAMAEKAGVDKLMYDLTGNGGGYVATAYYAVAALYPELGSPSNKRPWLNEYQRRVGKQAKFLIDSNLLPGSVLNRLVDFTDNPKYLARRAEELNRNTTEFLRLARLTVNLFRATDILVEAMSEAPSFSQTCGTISCRTLWDLSLSISNANLNFTDHLLERGLNKTLTGPLLAQFAEMMGAVLYLFIRPFSTVVPDTPRGNRQEYMYGAYYNITRGGVVGQYTYKYYPATAVTGKQFDRQFNLYEETDRDGNSTTYEAPLPKKSPFKQILAVGNGVCGSSCDTFSRTAWTYAQTYPDVPSFKYVTYGGTGNKQDITPTSFPGGNVQVADQHARMWMYYGFVTTLAHWSGRQRLIDTADAIGINIAHYPILQDNTPQYSESQIYHWVGDNPLPTEYYVIPTDLYLKQWYADTIGVGGNDLPSLYRDAAQFFE